ncbi:unnamed protein product [Rotaria sordida]|uniref:Uncharacterized protein n=1 Tax=Rotaria sordida TaxID=392033 RepID=A0A815FCD6_9BILA|nr:unnamed protein product [Rotaria sordida]
MSKSVNIPMPITIPMAKEEWTPEASKLRRSSIVREFALSTSTHGLPGIARSQSKHNCIFWTLSFLIFTGVMIYFVTESIQNYFQYPTQTSVSVVVEQSQTFPAVTICNYSPLRYDTFISPFLNYTNSINVTNTNDTTIFTGEQANEIYNFLRDKLHANESMDEYLFSLEFMLIECLYNNQKCTTDDFTFFLSSKHGFCYTFNAKIKDIKKSKIRQTNDDGGSGKLILRLYAHSDLYVPHVARDVTVGMVAMIHDNTQLPLIDVAGIELTPGRKHKLGYKKKQINFLSSPYTECTNQVPLVMQAMYNRYGGADYAYSQGVCYLLCIQAYIYEQCGCINPEEWSARSVVLSDKNTIVEARLCQFANKCYSNATNRISSTISIWNQFCSHCTQGCSTVDFIITKSSASAPSIEYAYMAKKLVESRRNVTPTDWLTNWLSEVQNNYVGLEVVCQSTEVENYTQEASVGPVDVLSNVGGHTGLWIGISFLSIMEFIEMLYRVLRYQCHATKQMIQNKIRRRQ